MSNASVRDPSSRRRSHLLAEPAAQRLRAHRRTSSELGQRHLSLKALLHPDKGRSEGSARFMGKNCACPSTRSGGMTQVLSDPRSNPGPRGSPAEVEIQRSKPAAAPAAVSTWMYAERSSSSAFSARLERKIPPEHDASVEIPTQISVARHPRRFCARLRGFSHAVCGTARPRPDARPRSIGSCWKSSGARTRCRGALLAPVRLSHGTRDDEPGVREAR
jgi:hypothetical protein